MLKFHSVPHAKLLYKFRKLETLIIEYISGLKGAVSDF